jgi:hypothetical protein
MNLARAPTSTAEDSLSPSKIYEDKSVRFLRRVVAQAPGTCGNMQVSGKSAEETATTRGSGKMSSSKAFLHVQQVRSRRDQTSTMADVLRRSIQYIQSISPSTPYTFPRSGFDPSL